MSSQRTEDTVDHSERRHCTDHTGMEEKMTGIENMIKAKTTLLTWILSGIGGAILMVLVYNQGRLDAQEKITAMLQANMANVEKQVIEVKTEVHDIQEDIYAKLR